MAKIILEKLLVGFKSARRIVSLLFLVLMMGTLVISTFQISGIDQFVSGILAVTGIVAAVSGLAYTHANSIPEPGRTWINREARNLFQGLILLVYVSALSWILTLVNKTNLSEELKIIFNVGSIIFLAVLLLGAFYWVISSIEYVSDALSHKDSIEEIEKRYKKSKSRLNALLGRISFNEVKDT